MQDKQTAIIIVIISLILLTGVFFININDSLSFISKTTGDGLGTLCDSELSCKDFCQNNRGRCDTYCNQNPSNTLCSTLFN